MRANRLGLIFIRKHQRGAHQTTFRKIFRLFKDYCTVRKPYLAYMASIIKTHIPKNVARGRNHVSLEKGLFNQKSLDPYPWAVTPSQEGVFFISGHFIFLFS